MKKMPLLTDVNGIYGKPAQGTSQFPTLADLLTHMDRLGIDRSLVWNIEATQNHSLASNAKLLEEIKSTPGAEGRIVPELVVSGTIFYEHNGVEKLKSQMRDGKTCALRYYNALGVCSLYQLEPVIDAISEHRPFIVMRNDAAPVKDILDFAERFPDVGIVLTEVIWGSFIRVIDLIRQRKNIMVENSWLHTTGVLEMIVEHFGPERVLFGTGHRSHNGAAIGELMRADISDVDRELIAHGNADLLLGNAGDAPETNKDIDTNTFWGRCVAGEKVDDDMIDAHAHFGPSAGYVLENQMEEDQVEPALRTMDSLGISTMIASGMQALLSEPVSGNDLLERVFSPHGDRFKGYVGFNPLYAEELIKHIDRWFGGDFFVGFKTLCSYWKVPITDDRFTPMWEYANTHRLPVLMHTWGGSFDAPGMLKDLVKQYPDVSFLFGHSGGSDGGRKQMEELAPGNPNVFMEWCGSFCSSIRWEDTLKKIEPSQVVFGSDGVAHSITWELARLLSLDAPDSTIKPMLGGNMRRILGRRR